MATAMSTPSLTSTITSNIKARGLAIIVTNDYSSSQDCLVKAKTRLPPLPGTLVDGVEMKAAFESIGFAVYWGKNVGQERFFKIIHEARSYPSYRKLQYKCVIFVFSGHGDSGDILYLQDGYSLNITRDFIEPFLPDSAYNLGSLPKLFFIDACRGEKNMDTVLVPGDSVPRGKIAPAEVDESAYARGGKKIDIKSIPAKGGVLVAYSTVSDYRAWERQDKGGVWLQLLAQEIRSSHCSIDDVLTIVNKKLVSKIQTANIQQPEKISRLNDVLYLHPEKDSEDTSQKKKPIIAAVFPKAPAAATPPPATDSLATPLDSPQEKVQTKPSQQLPSEPQQPLPVPGSLFIEVSRTGTSMAGQDLFHRMDTSLKESGFKPQYDYHSDGYRGPTHIGRYRLDGQQRKVDSSHSYHSKAAAKEQVPRHVFSQRNVMGRGGVRILGTGPTIQNPTTRQFFGSKQDPRTFGGSRILYSIKHEN